MIRKPLVLVAGFAVLCCLWSPAFGQRTLYFHASEDITEELLQDVVEPPDERSLFVFSAADGSSPPGIEYQPLP